MGSRPSGFDAYSGDENTIIHFNAIDETDKKKFLTSRLRNLKIQEEDIEKKLQEIEDFLARNILGEDLKNTPLVLFFLCELSTDDKLRNITGRSSLYEEIVRRIIIKHNISK